MMSERLGLTDEEVLWLQAKLGRDDVAGRMVRQYQMVVACPQDPGARGIFAAMLSEWRKTRVPLASTSNT